MKFMYLLKHLSLFTVLYITLSCSSMAMAQSFTIFVNPLQPQEYSLGNVSSVETADVVGEQPPVIQRSRSFAPEPPTMLLLLSGMVGMVIRFVRISFRAVKRVMDYCVSLMAIIVAAPLMLIIAILVKLTSRGPVIYRQERVGKDGLHFHILKFRSMTADAEKGTGAVWAKKNDPRITHFGMFLRKSHLDELPQLFNVLKGEMSIVGPRPERPEIVKDLKVVITDYEKRLQVLPGITGLAQVMNRYDETIADVRKKVKYDLLYIKKMCWLVEMRILALTCVVMVTGKGAK